MRRSIGVICACAAVLGAPSAALGAQPLTTSLGSPGLYSGPEAELAFSRPRSAGASVTRLFLAWKRVAPTRPLNPADPNDPAYRWSNFDRQVQLAVANGLDPIVNILYAPTWAQSAAGNPASWPEWDVSITDLALFTQAAVERYSGSTPGIPRVRLWQAWNEPNLSHFLSPQYVPTSSGTFDLNRTASVEKYRAMLLAFGSVVRIAHPDNLVIAGNLGPFSEFGPHAYSVGPLRFMRELFCIGSDLQPLPTCGPQLPIDAWATHPYTSGGPTHSASYEDDVSLGDLPEMRRLLDAAIRAGRTSSRRGVSFWVTEFGWDSAPPDPWGLPSGLHARWTAEALYRMWKNGVTLVSWYPLLDEAENGRPPGQVVQSGLYLYDARGFSFSQAKPALTAFRFPVVALKRGRSSVYVWLRTPFGRPGRVVVEQRRGSRWYRLGRIATNGHGIVSRVFRTPARGSVRARLASGESSLPFALDGIADRPVNPFGGPTQ
jgi:hypothetical protein